MKWMSFLAISILLVSPLANAIPPVVLADPVPALSQSFSPHADNTIIFNITNNVPKVLPLTVSGISGVVQRTQVANDCIDTLPAAASCNIGIVISLTDQQIGSSFSQTMQIDYEGRIPFTIPINFSVITPFAYVAPSPGAEIIYNFSLDSTTGLFTNTNTAITSQTQQYEAMVFATVNGTQYAYIVDQNGGAVYKCTLNTDGTFGSCTSTLTPLHTPSGWGPHGIAFATVNGTQYAYVVEVNNEEAFQCGLNADGSFNTCRLMTPSFTAPYGITFATVGGVQFAYVSEAQTGSSAFGTVYQCTLNFDGSFNTCTPTPASSAPNWTPYNTTFRTVGGTQYAYVADNGLNVGAGNVYQCSLITSGLNKGAFGSCSTINPSGPPSDWNPYVITFATLDGVQYAYVGNYLGPSSGGLYSCTLNNDGSLNVCTSTPSSPPTSSQNPTWQPNGIAFRFD